MTRSFMKMLKLNVLVVTILLISSVSAFVTPQTSLNLSGSLRHTTSPFVVRQQLQASPLPFADALEGYANFWVPYFQTARDAGIAPDFLIHWGHAGAMAAVLCSMGLIGSWMGWQIRSGNGNDVNALTLGETVREAHPKIMAGMAFFFLLGGQGGLVLNAVQGNPVLESTHALTATAGLAALAVQALLPLLFDKGSTYRTAHAYLGTGTIALFFAHMVTGLQLGFSF